MGDPLEAAQLYEEIGNLPEAARLYEIGGDRVRAAELCEKLGSFRRARALWESMGDWERQVGTLVKEGKLAEAAQILEEHGRLARAADLYEQAGQLLKALAIERTLGHWENVVRLAGLVGAHEEQAQAYEKLGNLQRAAEAYVEAGKVALAERPVREERVASLYEQAARLYDEIFEEELAYSCRRIVRRYRLLPEVDVRVIAEKVFVEREYNTPDLEVTNRGYGLAREIEVRLRGEFDIDGDCCIRGLRPQKSQPLEVSVRPHKGHFGPAVPLEVTVIYQDRHGTPYDFVYRARVHVEQQGILAGLGATTPLQINIQELYQRGARRVDTEVHDGGQVGDKVEINRGGARGMTIQSGEACVQVRRNGAPVRRCPICNVPEKDAGQNYCSDCGAPLDESPAR